MVIFFGNGIFRSKPQILLLGNGIGKAASCKAFYGSSKIVHALGDARLLKVVDGLADLGAVLSCEYKLAFSRARYFDLCGFIYVAISVTGYGDGFFPGLYIGFDALYDDGNAEYGSVQDCPDGAVRALPHLF